MKFEKKEIFNIFALLFIYLIIIFLLNTKDIIYGSEIDWLSQHYTFAEYFRNLFFENGNLIPSFSMNLGAGQNIFNFAYYGLLSPIVLISYLFPSVPMENYLSCSIIIFIALCIVLFYIWMRNNKYSESISFVSTLTFICASPIIFHTHRQIMFISYFPFLILSLIIIDNYFKTKKKYLLSITIFLIIMSSYFFSVTSLLVLAIYATYKFLKYNKFNVKSYIKTAIDLLKPILLGILASCILLLPILNIISKGRIGIQDTLSLKDLLPHSDLSFIFYNPYSLGFTSLFLIAISVTLFSQKKEVKFLSITTIIILFFPLIIYLLNGFLYLNSKVLIAFIPIACILVSEFLNDFSKNNINIKKSIITILIFILFIILTDSYEFKKAYYLIFLIEFIITFILFIISTKFNKKILIIPYCSLLIIFSLIVNSFELYINKTKFMLENNKYKYELIENQIKKDKEFYRFSTTTDNHSSVNKVYNKYYFTTSLYSSTYNNDFNNFYFNEFDNENPYRNTGVQYSSKNIMYDIFMGVKYKLSTFHDSVLSQKVNKKQNYVIYKNDYVYPIGYALINNLNIKDYNKLKYPFNIEALLISNVSEDKTNFNFEPNIKELTWDFNSFNIKNNNGRIKFKNNEEIIKRFYLPNELKSKALIISFKMNKEQLCTDGDTWIKINGVKNKLTCRDWKYQNNNKTFNYVLSNKNSIKSIKVTLSKGNFDISDLKMYTMDLEYLKKLNNNIDKLTVKRKDILDNGFVGTINVRKNSNFILTIPYDKNFIIKVDNKKVNYHKVNTSFIGFKITEGKHKIEVKYENKYLKTGMIISLLSFVIIVIMLIREKINYKQK